MIKRLEELNEINKKYNHEKDKLYLERYYKKMDMEKKQLDDFEEKLLELDENIHSREAAVDEMYAASISEHAQLLRDIYISSEFEIEEIGPILAELISRFEGKRFTFEKGLVPVKLIRLYEQYEMPIPGHAYTCALITDKSLSELKKKDIELYPYEDSLEGAIDKSGLLLYSGITDERYMTFYDINGKYAFDEKYPYIKDFIDTLIVSRIDDPYNFDPNNELSKFVEQRGPKVKKNN